MTILVLGATGKTGRRVVPRLRERGADVRAASRSGETRFDWTDRSSWADAVRGAEAVYLIAPEDPAPIEPFVSQAVAAGVRRFVTLSGRATEKWAGRFGAGMAEAERVVQASGAGWTILRSNNFDQNFDEDLWREPLLAGRLALPAGDLREPFVDVEDLAEVAATVLTSTGHDGRIYDLSGPESITFADAVETIAKVSGRPMEYVAVTPAAYRDELLAAGWPEEAVHELNALFEIMREGHVTMPTDDIERLLGRPATSFASYAERVWAG
ncbi:NAD(P)H-binding protein [Kribbella sp. NPDC023972]|uniref:NmrA family NAD(P)-binding protein n=1 Tax=Kribbella sp. NPDC023972 TaxID=3154795 RepID=UPI0033E59E75